MNKVLIICAHPDDDILGCGGYISKYSKSHKFRVLFIAEGSSCRFEDNKSQKSINEIKKRNSYAINALKILGVDDVKFSNLRCGCLNKYPILEINKIIEREINDFSPNIIFTHSSDDANHDHLVVHNSTIMATRPGSKFLINKLFTYEVLSSTEWKFTKTFKPNYFESLEEKDIKNKWKALSEYKTEIKPFPYPRSYEGIKVISQYRGMQSNKKYAEAFNLVREIN